MQNFFGSGAMVVTKNVAAGNPTPHKIGVLQDGSVDFDFDIKELHGQKSFPVAVGRGKGKVMLKAKFAALSARALADILFNPTTAPSTTQRVMVEDELKTPSGASPSTAVVTNTTGVDDHGVIDTVTGLQMKLTTGTPTAATDYSVNEATGTYTFANLFANQVLISYSYTRTNTVPSAFTIDSQQMGTAPSFSTVFGGTFDQGGALKRWFMKLNTCMAKKWTFGAKNDDFTIPDFEASCFADAAGNVGLLSFEE